MQIITIIMVAVGLSMDAFSLSILYGTLNFNKRKTLSLAGSVGVFHFFMPLFGNSLGLFLLDILPIKSNVMVGIIFFVISIQMLISIFKDEDIVELKNFFSIIIFAFTVSIDSFSAGIGLSMLCNNRLIAVSIFSITSFLFTFTGLTIGSRLTDRFGKVSTLVGSAILLILSLIYLFFYY